MQPHSPPSTDSEDAVNHRFDPAVDSVVDEVLTAVCGVQDVDPTEGLPLAEVVDPDALEDLFDPLADGLDDVAGYVIFTYEELTVTVRSEGLIQIVTQSSA